MERNEIEVISEEEMSETNPKLMEVINLQSQKGCQTPMRINTKEDSLKHIMV